MKWREDNRVWQSSKKKTNHSPLKQKVKSMKLNVIIIPSKIPNSANVRKQSCI